MFIVSYLIHKDVNFSSGSRVSVVVLHRGVTLPQGSYLLSHSGHKDIIEAVTQISGKITCCFVEAVIGAN